MTPAERALLLYLAEVVAGLMEEAHPAILSVLTERLSRVLAEDNAPIGAEEAVILDPPGL